MQFFAYKVKYDFHADDEASLDVSVGDIVLGSEKQLKGGVWILVQKSTPPYAHGYVPSHYLERAQKEACFGKKSSKLPSFVPGARSIIAKRSKDVIQKITQGEKGSKGSEDFSSLTDNKNWNAGLELHEKGDYLGSISKFKSTPSGITSKICFNIAQNYQTLSRFECAIFYYSQALKIDPYFAIAYFSRGNCYSNAGDSFQAALDFTSVLDILQHNTYIDYEPLGLNYLLQRGIVLWNRAVCFADIGMPYRAMEDLEELGKCAFSDEIYNCATGLLELLRSSHPIPDDDDDLRTPIVPSTTLISQGDVPSRLSVKLERPILVRPDYSPPSPNANSLEKMPSGNLEAGPQNNPKRRSSEVGTPPPTPPSESLANKRLSRSISGNIRRPLPKRQSSQTQVAKRTLSTNDPSCMKDENEQERISPAPRRPPRRNIRSRRLEFVSIEEIQEL